MTATPAFAALLLFEAITALWASGLRSPHLGGCRCRGLEDGGRVGVYGEGPWLGDEGIVVLICPANGVASLGVAVWVWVWVCWIDGVVLMSFAACGLMGVVYAHNWGLCMPCGAWATPCTGWRVWSVPVSPRCS